MPFVQFFTSSAGLFVSNCVLPGQRAPDFWVSGMTTFLLFGRRAPAFSSLRCRAHAVAAALAAWVALLAAAPAMASGSNGGGSFQVGATILVSCNVSGTTLNFGSNLDPLLTPGPVDASSTLQVVCTNTTPYSVALNAGLNAGGGSNFSARSMKTASNALPSQLYLDTGHATVWGDGAGSGVYNGTGTGSAQTLTI